MGQKVKEKSDSRKVQATYDDDTDKAKESTTNLSLSKD